MMKINPIKIANFIEKSKTTQKVLRFFDANPSLGNSTVVFGLATVLRPSAIFLSGGNKAKDKRDDALYSMARSITTGFVDLASAFAIFVPLNKAIDKSTRILFNNKDSAYFKNKEACSAWKSIFNRGAKIALLPALAYFNFKYVRKVVDKMRVLNVNRKNNK